MEESYYPCSENKGADQLRSKTVKLICTFVFAKAKIQFSHDAAQLKNELLLLTMTKVLSL